MPLTTAASLSDQSQHCALQNMAGYRSAGGSRDEPTPTPLASQWTHHHPLTEVNMSLFVQWEQTRLSETHQDRVGLSNCFSTACLDVWTWRETLVTFMKNVEIWAMGIRSSVSASPSPIVHYLPSLSRMMAPDATQEICLWKSAALRVSSGRLSHATTRSRSGSGLGTRYASGW